VDRNAIEMRIILHTLYCAPECPDEVCNIPINNRFCFPVMIEVIAYGGKENGHVLRSVCIPYSIKTVSRNINKGVCEVLAFNFLCHRQLLPFALQRYLSPALSPVFSHPRRAGHWR